MKKLIVTLFIITCGISSIFSQSCLPEGITFTTQEQIDNFHIDYPDCNNILGSVEVSIDGSANLNGLLGLTEIGGSFLITGEIELVNMHGLDSLTRINSGLVIDFFDFYEANISSFEGLEKLHYLGSNFQIIGSVGAEDLNGLSSLDTIAGSIKFELGGLNSLNGLNSLSFLGGDLYMCPFGINDISALTTLTSIGGKITLIYTNLQNLSGLENLTEVGGDLSLSMNENLENVDALNSLIQINGSIGLFDNSSLTSIQGMKNISAKSISQINLTYNGQLSQCEIESVCDYIASQGADVTIENNAPGCNNLEEVEFLCNNQSCPDGNFTISSQLEIDSFQENHPGCNEIDGDLLIEGNSIENLDGLNVLININGSLTLKNNPNLQNLDGLGNITQIDGSLLIHDNPLIETLNGIPNILYSTITDILILNNQNLSTCHVLSICSFLAASNTNILISGNAMGCTSAQQVEDSCALITCFPDGIEFTSQSQIDNFENMFPGCHSIEGDIEIHGYNIQNINGLNFLQSIGGNLDINNVNNLENINGLNNLVMIGEDFVIENTGISEISGLNSLIEIGNDLNIKNNSNLVNINGFESLTEIGDDLFINENINLSSVLGMNLLSSIQDNCYLTENQNLESLSGFNSLQHIGGLLQISGSNFLVSLMDLEYLTSINGMLKIENNTILSSLDGLNNIQPGSIQHLVIEDNISLQDCAIECICDYLISPSGTLRIEDNASGCNTVEEVEQVCQSISVFEHKFKNNISVFPNPAKDKIFISCSASVKIEEVNLYTLIGERISGLVKKDSELDVSKIPNGLYILEVISDTAISKFKIQIN